MKKIFAGLLLVALSVNTFAAKAVSVTSEEIKGLTVTLNLLDGEAKPGKKAIRRALRDAIGKLKAALDETDDVGEEGSALRKASVANMFNYAGYMQPGATAPGATLVETSENYYASTNAATTTTVVTKEQETVDDINVNLSDF